MAGSAALLLAINPSAGSGPPPALSAFVTPNQVGANTTNGTWTSPKITVNPSGGTAPYSYEWSATNGFTVSAPTAQKTTVSASGFDTIKSSELTCKVTDDNLDTVEVTITVAVAFGTQL